MPLRDYFAGQAAIGITAEWSRNGLHISGVAKDAYAVADAMLKERSK